MEHFLKKTTSVSSSMNQSGESPSDIKSPPLLSQTATSGSRTSNTSNQVEQRPSILYTSSIRPQSHTSISNTSQVVTNMESNQTISRSQFQTTGETKANSNSMSMVHSNSQNGPKTLDSTKNTTEKEYTEIERIEVPNFSTHRVKDEELRNKKSETSTDPPMKSGQSSDDEEDSSDTTSTDSFSECSESSNECAKLDFADEDNVEEEGSLIYQL